MHFNQLGKTDLHVSVIGFGAATLGNEYGEMDASTGERVVHAAIEQGINFFDTSPYYGRTLSEERLGKALRGYRERVLIATKAGRYDVKHFDFSAERLVQSAEESLGRLQTDVIDLYQLHDIEFVEQTQIINEALPTLRRLQEQGKIRYIGITGYPVRLLKSIAEISPVDTILSYCHYNLLNTELADILVPLADEQGIGLINASALHMGILTANGAPEWHPASQIIHEIARQAAHYSHEQGIDIAQLALQFAFYNAPVSTTLVGMSTPEQVIQNVQLINTKPNPETLKGIQALFAPVHNKSWRSGLPEHHEPTSLKEVSE